MAMSKQEILESNIKDFNVLNERTLNRLQWEGIEHLEDFHKLLSVKKHGVESFLLRIPSFGAKSLAYFKDFISQLGITYEDLICPPEKAQVLKVQELEDNLSTMVEHFNDLNDRVQRLKSYVDNLVSESVKVQHYSTFKDQTLC